MSEREERLSDLKDEIYNAEDVIDGVYNSKDKNYSDLIEINQRYNQLLKDMNTLIELLDNVT